MSRTGMCGFEMGSTGEAQTVTGSPSIQTAIVRSGAYAMRNNNPGAQAWLAFSHRVAGGTFNADFLSCRFYFRINAVPSAGHVIWIWSLGPQAGTPTTAISYTADTGTLSLFNSTGGTATGSIVIGADGAWHRIEVSIGNPGSFVVIDNVTDINNTGVATTQAAAAEMRIGTGVRGAVGNFSGDFIFEDLLWDNASFSSTSYPGDSKQIILLPTAGNNAGSWTGGAGGTGDIHGAVASVPPNGKAVANEDNTTQIKNAASGTTLDYVATMQSYSAAGIPPGSTINAVQAVVNDAEEVSTNTKSGATWIASNPTQSAVTVGSGVGFDYGNDGGAVGAFPSGWATHLGVLAAAPSITLGTAPTMTVRKGSSTTRVVDVDAMYIYVDYTPPPVAKIVGASQAVKRASFF